MLINPSTQVMKNTSRNDSTGFISLQVATRIRPISAKEINDKETVIAKIDAKERTVICKGKKFGPFAKVYGEKTTQEAIYTDLVKPMVKKVVNGFNCTVFAYGQTGTGKTFTMEGGKRSASITSCNDDPSSGIIPRAVEDIFLQLESMGCEEYSIRISYLELYNEELFDLLTTSGTEDEQRERLRIYDDQKGKGVVIQGVEEVPVRNRADVFRLLDKGSEKRTTAQTNMNERSSRSHSLFIVHVVIREIAPSGEEFVKQGKLNLVDLAGSENIGRSGVIGRRAKEAGNINQSLLTLGRVIRALTTNATHTPYRESKLTRLLQDSLGGTTYTSLIATLSPSSSNFEESQSTLEYALSAANIKNRPVCNTKLSKKTVIKEFNEEIERLRRDLRAARDRNGITISNETHDMYEQNAERIRDLEEQMLQKYEEIRKFAEDQVIMDEQYAMLYSHKERLTQKLTQRVNEIAEKEMQLAIHVKALEELDVFANQTVYNLEQTIATALDLKTYLSEYADNLDVMKEAQAANKKTLGSLKTIATKNANDVSTIAASLHPQLKDGLGHLTSNADSSEANVAENVAKIEEAAKDTTKMVRSVVEDKTSSSAKLLAQVEMVMKKTEETINIAIPSAHESFATVIATSTQVTQMLLERLSQIKPSLEEMMTAISVVDGDRREHVHQESQRRLEELKTTSRRNAEMYTKMREEMAAHVERFNAQLRELEETEDAKLKCIESSEAAYLDRHSQLDEEANAVRMAHADTVDEACGGVEELVSEAQAKLNTEKTNVVSLLDKVTEAVTNAATETREEAANELEKTTMAMKKVTEVSEKFATAVSTTMADIQTVVAEVAVNANKCEELVNTAISDHQSKLTSASNDLTEGINAAHFVTTQAEVAHRSLFENVFISEAPQPPTIEELLKVDESDENQRDTRRRVSFYRPRESMLSDTSNIIASPATLKANRNECATIEEEE